MLPVPWKPMQTRLLCAVRPPPTVSSLPCPQPIDPVQLPTAQLDRTVAHATCHYNGVQAFVYCFLSKETHPHFRVAYSCIAAAPRVETRSRLAVALPLAAAAVTSDSRTCVRQGPIVDEG